MARIGKDARDMILCSLAGKAGGEARGTIEDLSEKLGVSVRYIYKITSAVRPNGRAVRQDAGVAKISITPEQLAAVRAFTANYDLTAEAAIGLAELNDIVPPGLLKPYKYNEWLRAQQQERSRYKVDVKPARQFEARGPNVLHQFDTTKLEQLHFDRKTGVLSWDPRANRKNSRGEKPEPIWLYSILDDHSRAKFAYLYRYENQYNHLDFLYRAWAQKARPAEFPFYGIPSHLYMDKGPVNYAGKVLKAIRLLDIHLVPTTPSTSEPFGSRKHGKVENVFKTYNEWLKLFQIRSMTWDEAQEYLYQFLLKINGEKIHSVTRQRPFERWLSVHAPRHMPEEQLYQLLNFDHQTRVVTNYLTFSVDRHTYKLPERRPYVDWIDREIEVYWEPLKYEKVFAVRGTVEIELAECIDNLVRPAFSYPREDPQPTAIAEARAAAGGADHSGIKLWATDAPKQKYLSKPGEVFDGKAIAEKTVETLDGTRRPSFAPERWLNYFQAVSELQGEGFLSRPLKPGGAEQAWLKGLFNERDKIAETELRAAVAAAQSTEDKAAEA